jgi:hypothetical protein
MAHSLSITNVIEKNKLASTNAMLVLLDIGVRDSNGALVEWLRVVQNTEEITYQGNLYAPTAFELSIKQETNSQAELQVVFQDMTRGLQTYLQAYGGGVGFDVYVTLVNSGNLSQPPEIQEMFQVVNTAVDNYVVTFSLGAENPLTRLFPRRLQNRDFCPWKYKGAECGYVGGLATCDRTLLGVNGCAAHNNTLRFGGYPGLNATNRRYA